MKNKKLIVGLIFLALSFLLIKFALTTPCNIEPITQKVLNQVSEMSLPKEFQRLTCLSSDYKALFSLWLGIALIFPAIKGIFEGLTK